MKGAGGLGVVRREGMLVVKGNGERRELVFKLADFMGDGSVQKGNKE